MQPLTLLLPYSLTFSNAGDGKNGFLDCTHSVGAKTRGMYGVHKYFIQAMLEDYFETKHAKP